MPQQPDLTASSTRSARCISTARRRTSSLIVVLDSLRSSNSIRLWKPVLIATPMSVFRESSGTFRDRPARIRSSISHRRPFSQRRRRCCASSGAEIAHTTDSTRCPPRSPARPQAHSVLDELAEVRAIPRLAEPFQEVRDKWNRISYRLSMDDGNTVEIVSSVRLELGATYAYFGSETNPTPVDPLLLKLSELEGTQ